MVVTHWVGLTLRKVCMVGTQEEGESGWRWVGRDPGARHWAFVGNVCWSTTFNNWLSRGGGALIYQLLIPFQATHMRSLRVELGKEVPNWFRKTCRGRFQHTHWLWADAGVSVSCCVTSYRLHGCIPKTDKHFSKGLSKEWIMVSFFSSLQHSHGKSLSGIENVYHFWNSTLTQLG